MLGVCVSHSFAVDGAGYAGDLGRKFSSPSIKKGCVDAKSCAEMPVVSSG